MIWLLDYPIFVNKYNLSEMKKICIFIAVSLLSLKGFGQVNSKDLCGKKWHPNKYKEVDGKLYDFDKPIKALYTIFNCDGTFESWEDINVLIKGKWVFDSKINSVKMVSRDSNFPMDEIVEIISCKDHQLVFKKKDGGGEQLTIYSISK